MDKRCMQNVISERFLHLSPYLLTTFGLPTQLLGLWTILDKNNMSYSIQLKILSTPKFPSHFFHQFELNLQAEHITTPDQSLRTKNC